MATNPIYDWDNLIRDDCVHRSIYTDPNIFEREIERIFERGWVYVGHTSQVPNHGDYYSTTIGRQPVILVRHNDGNVHTLFNRCAHKGAQLVSDTSGNVKEFRCSYHGWCYKTDGSNRAIPMEQGYEGSALDKKNSRQVNMSAVARQEIYRGFVFASLSDDVPDFSEWIRGIDTSIDNMVDRSPEGELEMVPGCQRYLMDCNWKFHVENLNDMMHPMVAHQSSSQTGRKVADRHFKDGENVPMAVEILAPFTNKYSFFDEMGLSYFKHGHSYSGGKVSIHSAYSDIPEYQALMEEKYGEKRTQEIFSENRHNTVIYPNLTIKGAIQTIRVCRPIAVDQTLIESFTLKLKGAPDELLQRSVLYATLINSSAGLVQPDDHECYIRMQNGLHSDGNEWVSMHRHLDRDEQGPGGGRRAIGTSDAVFRNQYQAWKSFMQKGDQS